MVKKGMRWSVVGSTLNKVISILVFLVLAQKLPPSDFGILAILTILVGFASIFTQAGYKEAIIYFQIRNGCELSSIFSLLLLLNTTVFVLTCYFLEEISGFFGGGIDSEIRYISLLLFLYPLKVISSAQLESELRFKRIILLELVAVVLSSVVALVMAFNNFGAMSLVAMLVVKEVCVIVGLFFSTRWRVNIDFGFARIKYIYSYSAHLISYSFVNYTVENLDRVLIASLMGKADVGIYHRSLQLTSMPAMFVMNAVSRVLFPYLVGFKDSIDRVRMVHLEFLSIVAFIGFPFLSLLFVYADPLVRILLGESWALMVPLLKIFSVMGIFRIMSFLSVNLYKCLGQTKLQNKVNLLLKAIILVAILSGYRWGVEGLAYALLISRIINFLITQYFVSRLILASFSENISSLAPPLLFVAAMVSLFNIVVDLSWISSVGTLILASLLFLATYFSLGFVLFRSKFLAIRNYV